MTRVAIRVNGGKNIGYGHFYRCLSLARAFNKQEENINILFLINIELEELLIDKEFDYIIFDDKNIGNLKKLDIDLFILDSYDFDDHYLLKVKKNSKLMLIDDNNDIYDSSIPDILYNGNIFAKDLNYKPRENQVQFLGSEYLIIREEYWKDDFVSYLGEKNIDLLITTGGSDHKKIGKDILSYIVENDVYKDREISYVIGPGYENGYIEELKKFKDINFIYKPESLRKYIESSKTVLTSAGSTVYEALLLKTNIIVFSYAKNQNRLYKKLIENGILGMGIYPDINYNVLNIYNKLAINKYDLILPNSTMNLTEGILKYLEVE